MIGWCLCNNFNGSEYNEIYWPNVSGLSGSYNLFNFNEVAAQLGKQSNADWVVVGRHSKPSFLFSYLMAHLINVRTQQLVGD